MIFMSGLTMSIIAGIISLAVALVVALFNNHLAKKRDEENRKREQEKEVESANQKVRLVRWNIKR